MVHFWYCTVTGAVVGVWRCTNRDAPLFLWCFPHISIKENATVKHLFLFSLLFLSIALFSAEIKGKVVAVADGDTITVLDEMDHASFKIRLDKIDAPEKEQAFGNKAKLYLSSLIFGKQVSVRFKAVDRYGRILGVVFCDGHEPLCKMDLMDLMDQMDMPQWQQNQPPLHACRNG